MFTRTLLAAAAIVLLAAPPCSAQAGGTIEVSPALGIYFPTENFEPGGPCFFAHIEVNGAILPYGPCDVPGYRQTTVLAPGAHLTLWVSRRIAIDGTLEYSPSTTRDNVLAGNVRALFGVVRAGPMLWYVAGGAALVAHSGVTLLTYTDTTVEHFTPRFGGVVGGGGHLRVAPGLAIRADLEKYFSSYEGSSQRDLFFSLALSVALRDTGRKRSESRQ